jgi:hypothetical protein
MPSPVDLAAPPTTSPAAAPVASTRFSRLSHAQWENTVRDLLRLPGKPGLAGTFREDAVVGFDSHGGTLDVGDDLRVGYESAAESLAARIAGDPEALRRLIPADAPAGARERGRAFIESFGLRAHRRPLTADEQREYLALFERGPMLVRNADPFAAGVQVVLGAFLQSPLFLYRTELGTKVEDGRIPLDDYEIASKLSYALIGSMPDDALFAAAARGALAKADGLRAEATRLLEDPRARDTIDHFHYQMLSLETYDGITKDKKLFPTFTSALIGDMRAEALTFLRHQFTAGTYADVLTAPYSFVNKRLAAIYGLPGAFGDDLVKTDLDPKQRAGLLTQVGFLARHATTTEPDIIHRGVFVNKEILCFDLPPPAPGVDPVPSGEGKTNRERVERHTGKGTCGEACHGNLVNPPGFAFEHYDALGVYRTHDAGEPVDASGTYAFSDGLKSFKDALELIDQLAARPETHACYAKHLLAYLYGRAIDDKEKGLVAYLAGQSRAARRPLRALALEMVTHPSFTTRTP